LEDKKMKKDHRCKGVIIAIIAILGFTLALLIYFYDLPLLWTVSILAVVISTGIVGYILGYLIGQRRDS
jgi:VIT1/CCC1 family predicted Fe2+/Mn2+ transporter